VRLFVSVDLPDCLGPGIRAIQTELGDASGLTLIDPTQAHLTLKFLGEVPEGRLEAIEDALSGAVDSAGFPRAARAGSRRGNEKSEGSRVDSAGVGPFEATVEGIGAFPSRGYIRVVWLGIGRGSQELTRLHEAIEARTTEMGFDPGKHEFTPHVTLARMTHAGGKDRVQRVLRERDPEVGTMRVEAVRLTESDLGSGKPAYSTVARFPLEG
jgi:2'-5' RNA ligase